jgi:hypothetical protein
VRSLNLFTSFCFNGSRFFRQFQRHQQQEVPHDDEKA